MAQDSKRSRPSILVTGTPGTGKTTTSTALAESTQLRHINIGELVREKNLHDGWDDELECHVINEDLVFKKKNLELNLLAFLFVLNSINYVLNLLVCLIFHSITVYVIYQKMKIDSS